MICEKSKNILLVTWNIVLLTFLIIALIIYEDLGKDPSVISKIENEGIIPVELTPTPADNYPPNEQAQHCGSSDARSNLYIKEFKIPTPCTQPLSITTDFNGDIWFAQTNTGNIAKFDPISERFTEYQNEQWNSKRVSMMWGISYTQDDEIWFTDEGNDSIWKFSINEEKYTRFDFIEKDVNSFPQKISLFGNSFLINDFTGGQMVVVDHDELDNWKTEYFTINVPEKFFTSQAVVDNDGNIWFVMWKFQKESILIKSDPITKEIEQFTLSTKISAPNGISVDSSGRLWIADTASSSFFSFDPASLQTIEYVTSRPPIWVYGNSTGLIKTPITRPYWTDFDSEGKLWFSEQTANRLSVFDPKIESLIEYDIPSKNPTWSDCGEMDDCGVSQNFGFTIKNELVWFTEWVENNIGVLDTSIPLPIAISIDNDEIEIKQGQQKEIFVTVTPQTNQELELVLAGNTNSKLITIKTKSETKMISDESVKIPVIIIVDKDAHKVDYKILISTQLQDVTVSSYVTIKIL